MTAVAIEPGILGNRSAEDLVDLILILPIRHRRIPVGDVIRLDAAAIDALFDRNHLLVREDRVGLESLVRKSYGEACVVQP